jgi:transcriptional regulator with XRE-family HTH domain
LDIRRQVALMVSDLVETNSVQSTRRRKRMFSPHVRSPNELDLLLGQRVRARRIVLGLSREQLASKLGVTFQQVRKYEMGQNRIAASRLCQISSVLDCPLELLLDGFAPSTRASGLAWELSTPGARELLSLFATLREVKARQRILDLVRAVSAALERSAK